jgi:hypothetical protein
MKVLANGDVAATHPTAAKGSPWELEVGGWVERIFSQAVKAEDDMESCTTRSTISEI